MLRSYCRSRASALTSVREGAAVMSPLTSANTDAVKLFMSV